MNPLYQDTQLFSLKEPSVGEMSFEGTSLKNVLILTGSVLKKDESDFLIKILGSVKLELTDVLIIDSDKVPLFHHVKSAIQFNKVMLFGITPFQIGLNIQYENYAPVHFLNTDILVADNLTVIQDTESSKTLLWKSLKKMFLENVPG